LPQDQLSAAYGACDVVVTPSVYLDPFILVNIEAMANAKPVIGTCFGGTPEIVQDEKTGFIRNPLKIQKFADSIVRLLENKDLAIEMGKEGKKIVEQKFTTEIMTSEYLKIYSYKT
jgi:glycosyltransferase involved in cell wall biosynthesis